MSSETQSLGAVTTATLMVGQGRGEVLFNRFLATCVADPFERFHEARGFDEWQENRSWALTPAMGVVQKFFESFEDYPAPAGEPEL